MLFSLFIGFAIGSIKSLNIGLLWDLYSYKTDIINLVTNSSILSKFNIVTK
jgi:hypothetical protein